MEEIDCYRILRSPRPVYRLESDGVTPSERVKLVCLAGVRASRSAAGELLLYHEGPYGVHPEQAIQLGWCRLAEADPAPRGETCADAAPVATKRNPS